MSALYAKIHHAKGNPLTELTRVAPFANLLRSTLGHAFPFSDDELLVQGGVPDPKVSRQVSRSGCLLLLHYRELQRIVRESGVPGARIGIYATMSQSPSDWVATAEIAKAEPSQFASAMRKQLPRKQIFKTSAYSGITQLGILLGIQGPQFTFFDENEGFPFMIDQARFDLETGHVDLAILAAANALDESLLLAEGARETRFREASACLVVSREAAALLRERPLEREAAWGSAGGLVAFMGEPGRE